ncbi:MAG: hypothetical protein ACI8U4_002162 [Natronomonas sp.]
MNHEQPMVSRRERYGWVVVMGVLMALAIPWFLWGDSRMAYGLPLWLWWHIGWMTLAALAFWTFANRAWGIGITEPLFGEGGT